MAARVLVVDDEKLIRWSLSKRLTQEGYQVAEAGEGASASRLLETETFDLALLDMRLPDTDGMTLMRKAREAHPDLPVLIITAYSSVNNAVEAMKGGAYDYITKPFSMDELVINVRRALEVSAMKRRLSAQVSQQKERFGLTNIIGESAAMVEIRNLIVKLARNDATTILLVGENGTGKDMIARAIHYESRRAERPFMNITCAAFPDTLLEYELFGFDKNAIASAKAPKKGVFELADEGTIYLDEIADAGMAAQARLLRALEDKSFKRVGGTADIAMDVRVVAATCRDLKEEVEKGAFREDLLYRLSIVPIYVPPLRARRDDVPLLADHFLTLAEAAAHRYPKRLSAKAVEKLRTYDWPGNIRELRNTIERAVLLSPEETIGAEDILLGRTVLGRLDTPERFTVRLPLSGCKLTEIERELVVQALQRTNWNQTRAADLLGISRDQIRYKMEKFNLARN